MTAHGVSGSPAVPERTVDAAAKMNRWLLECLDAVAELHHSNGDLSEQLTPAKICEATTAALLQFVETRALGFWVVDRHTHDFTPLFLTPAAEHELLIRELDSHIESGTFAWAMSQNRPVIVPATMLGNRALLHVMATKARVVGMYLAIIGGRRSFIPEAAQKFTSIALSNCASRLESLMLYSSLADHAKNLAAKVAERTRELERSEAKAKAASRAKGDFLASMSHEIRTPISGVIGMTELLLETALSEEQLEFARTIHSSGEALLGIINDILDLSKIEAGGLDIEAIEFDLRTAVESALDVVSVRAGEKGLELVCMVAPDVPSRVVGDPGRIRQILLNMLSNAIKFTEQGEVVLRVRAESDDGSNTLVRFEVQDTGIGLTPAAQAKIFQPFVQADSSTTRKFGGTGLGLTICKRLAELMGGAVGARSAEGVGSTFWFTAYLEQKPDGPEHGGVVSVDLKGIRVLVVDDNATAGAVLREQLVACGADADVVDTATAAVRRLREGQALGRQYGVALLDKCMPEMGGIELAKQIKSNPEISHIPLILVTAVGQRGDRAAATEVGFSGYLTKPIRREQLQGCVSRVLGLAVDAEAGRSSELITKHTLADETARHRPRVLLAEDNPVNQKIAVRFLEKLGCRVDVVDNGRDAVEAVERVSYAAVLMDCSMPELDGYEATTVIREREGDGRHTAIIALTADATERSRQQCLEVGMDDFVTKPVKREVLGEVLRPWIERATTKVESEASPETPATDSSDSGSAGSAIDLEAFRRQMEEMDVGEMVEELLETFAQDAPERLAAIEVALSDGDAEEIRAAAHAYKSAAATIHAEGLAGLLRDMERAGRDGDVERARQLFTDLHSENSAVLAQLQQRANGG